MQLISELPLDKYNFLCYDLRMENEKKSKLNGTQPNNSRLLLCTLAGYGVVSAATLGGFAGVDALMCSDAVKDVFGDAAQKAATGLSALGGGATGIGAAIAYAVGWDTLDKAQEK